MLLDLTMPVMGGEEAFALLTKINPGVPIILSTGFDETEATERFSGLKELKLCPACGIGHLILVRLPPTASPHSLRLRSDSS